MLLKRLHSVCRPLKLTAYRDTLWLSQEPSLLRGFYTVSSGGCPFLEYGKIIMDIKRSEMMRTQWTNAQRHITRNLAKMAFWIISVFQSVLPGSHSNWVWATCSSPGATFPQAVQHLCENSGFICGKWDIHLGVICRACSSLNPV